VALMGFLYLSKQHIKRTWNLLANTRLSLWGIYCYFLILLAIAVETIFCVNFLKHFDHQFTIDCRRGCMERPAEWRLTHPRGRLPVLCIARIMTERSFIEDSVFHWWAICVTRSWRWIGAGSMQFQPSSFGKLPVRTSVAASWSK